MSDEMIHRELKSKTVKWNIFLTVSIATLSGLLFGFDTGIIADTQHTLTAIYKFSELQWSLIVSSTVFGAFVGSISSGFVTDAIGRRAILLCCAVGFIIGTLFLVFEHGYNHLLIGRFIIGVSIGVGSYATPLFISEISPPQARGRLVLCNSIMITLGETIAYIVGYALHDISEHSYREMFLTGLFPAVLLLIGAMGLPKSPRWLISQGKFDDALTMLKKIRPENDAMAEYAEIKSLVSENNTSGSVKELLTKKLRVVFLMGITLGVLQQLAGINTVMYYGPYIFMQAGLKSDINAILATFIMGCINTLTTLLVVCIVDKIGRRKLLLTGTLTSAVCLLMVATIFDKGAVPVQLTLIIFCLYVFSFSLSLGSLFWLIISEIYPTSIRGLAMSIVVSVQWIANFTVSIAFLPLAKWFGALNDVFYIFSFICFFAFIFSYLFVPETKGVSLELIERNLNQYTRVRSLGDRS